MLYCILLHKKGFLEGSFRLDEIMTAFRDYSSYRGIPYLLSFSRRVEREIPSTRAVLLRLLPSSCRTLRMCARSTSFRVRAAMGRLSDSASRLSCPAPAISLGSRSV